MECVLALQAAGRLQLDDLIDVVPVDDAQSAYERLLGDASNRPHGALALAYDGLPDGDTQAEPPRKLEVQSSTTTGARRAATAPIRVGLIGPGNFAKNVLLPAFVAAGTRLEIVAGGSGPSAEALGRNAGFARVGESATSVIEDPSVDAVVIATRHRDHATLVVEALRAGKHVFCEKPVAVTVQELEAVLEAAEQSSAILAVGFNRRFAPLLREARTFLSATGSPLAATYRVSAGHLPPDHWTHDLDEGGGRIIGEGCHFVDSLAFLADSSVVEVHATGYGDPQLPVEARDTVTIALRFADGSVGSILYVAEGSGRVPKERLEGFSGGRTAILDDYRELELFEPTGSRKQGGRTQDKGHREEIAAFVRGAERGEFPVPLEEIANVSLATIAAVEALRSGLPVRLEQ